MGPDSHTPDGTRPSLLPGIIFLLILAVIFYAALWYFSGGVYAAAESQRLMLVVAFCGAFCLYLGHSGVKVTGRWWVAPLVHILFVALLLILDIPAALLVEDFDIVGIILAVVGGLTTLGGLFVRR